MEVQRRPAPGKPAGYGPTKKSTHATREFNKTSKFVQGFRSTLPAIGSLPVTIKLNSPGKFLLGIAVFPASGINADISDCTLLLSVNGFNILTEACAQNAIPSLIQGFLFLPTPQPLQGDDNIVLTISKKSGVGTPIVYTDIFYIPR